MKFVNLSFGQNQSDDYIAKVELNRQEVRNAFNPQMIDELCEAFLRIPQTKNVRVIHLSGAGKSFCAGGDLQWMQEMKTYSEEENRKDADRLFQMFETILRCPVPLVTTVHGAVFGGALGLIACSDFVICEEKTQLCFSEVKLGIAPAVISSFVLHKTTLGHVQPWMLSGHIFQAEQARTMGLVHIVCEDEFLQDHSLTALSWFKETGPHAVKSSKNFLRDIPSLTWAERRQQSTQLIAELRVSPEGQEGLTSFLEKRKPNWRIP